MSSVVVTLDAVAPSPNNIAIFMIPGSVIGRCVVRVHRGAGQGARAWMLPLQRLYSHGLPLAGATRNGCSIARRSNADMCREGRAIRIVATAAIDGRGTNIQYLFYSFACVHCGAVNCRVRDIGRFRINLGNYATAAAVCRVTSCVPFQTT
jgi:hypothetical protein